MNVDPTIMKCANELAKAHRELDPQTTNVYLFTSPEQEVRLVEVSGSVDTTSDTSAMRFTACPSKGIEYSSAVVLLSPEEWKRVTNKELELPEGWNDYIEIP